MSDLYLYHATGKENLKSVMSKGLLISPPKHAYASEIGLDALMGKIFLALSADAAEAYAEVSEAFDDIVVFKIKLDDLNITKFKYDRNNRCEHTDDINSCVYTDDIPANIISLCDPNTELDQDISDFEGTRLYDIILAVFDEEVETNKEGELV